MQTTHEKQQEKDKTGHPKILQANGNFLGVLFYLFYSGCPFLCFFMLFYSTTADATIYLRIPITIQTRSELNTLETMSGDLLDTQSKRESVTPTEAAAAGPGSSEGVRLPSEYAALRQLPDEISKPAAILYKQYAGEESRVLCFKYSVELSKALIEKEIPHKELRLRKPTPPGEKRNYLHYVLEVNLEGKPLILDLTQDQFHKDRKGPGVFSRKEFLSTMEELGYKLERERSY